MDKPTSDKIRLRLHTLREKSLKQFEKQLWLIFPARDPITQTQVSEAGRAAELNVRELLSETVIDVRSVSRAPEAFRLVRDHIANHIADLERVMEQGRANPFSHSIMKMVNDRCDAVRQRVHLELERFTADFTVEKDPGGRPRKHDWEGALLHLIAVANHDGLALENQTEIRNIISDWFIQRTGEMPADSAVKAMARRVLEYCREYEKA
jgi:hypothetical protein